MRQKEWSYDFFQNRQIILGADEQTKSNQNKYHNSLILLGQVRVVVQLCPVRQAAGPGVDASDGVGGGFLTLLVLAVVPGDSAVGRLGLHSLAVRAS